MFRLASAGDITAIANIYDAIHTLEEKGPKGIGWLRSIYPTEDTARLAVEAGEMYVLEKDGIIVAAGKINKEQMPAYAEVNWVYPAKAEEVLVLHTLVVDPKHSRKGYGREFAMEYERMACESGCKVLRIDTNAINSRARNMYSSIGYREAGIIPCVFCGIPDVDLVCLEKKLDINEG